MWKSFYKKIVNMSPNYTPPLEEIKFLLNNFLNAEEVLSLCNQDIDVEVVNAILEQAALFAKNELAPINNIGDIEGCKFDNGAVKTATGFKEAYKKFIESGWNAVPFSPEYGGQGLPWLISVAISEMWNGANMAFALCPLLTQGAVEALTHHASKEQKDKYLSKLISGEWTGTMCLTESQAGSDLAAIRTKATKSSNHYLIKGQKIFITYGEHDYTSNIIHMVLARTANAPDGVKGISLFIVPKILDNGVRNDVRAISIEHKLGIHASPTAVMSFGDNDGAVGYLVGEENQGLKYMFTMMNNARLSVGVEGLGISENSYQQAFAYANERVQGKVLRDQMSSIRSQGEKNLSETYNLKPDTSTIINHPDVARMLLTIRAHTEASRAIIYYVARSMDLARYHQDENIRQTHQDVVDLLTPVAKAHATELGFSNSSLAMQVFGGVGYIEETGIAQNLRDSRIAMIYEGTNGIQAMDLVFRKLALHEGRLFTSFINILSEEAKEIEILKNTTKKIQKLITENPSEAATMASLYLRLFGIVVGGVFLNQCKNITATSAETSAEFIKQKIATVEFYNKYIIPEIYYISGIIGT